MNSKLLLDKLKETDCGMYRLKAGDFRLLAERVFGNDVPKPEIVYKGHWEYKDTDFQLINEIFRIAWSAGRTEGYDAGYRSGRDDGIKFGETNASRLRGGWR